MSTPTSPSGAAFQAALFIALISAASSDATRAQSGAPASSAIAIVCRDGALVPLASHDVRGWHDLTAPEEGLDYYFGRLTDAARLLPKQGWTLFRHDGASPRAFFLTPAARVAEPSPASCAYVEPIKTDLRSVRGRPGDDIGFAILGGGTIVALEEVTAQPDAASRLVAQWFVRRLLSEEPRLLAPENPYLFKPSPVERQKAVVRVKYLARQTTGDGALYYGEAEKQYRPLGTRVLVQAWLRQSRNGITTLSRQSALGDGEEKGWIWRRGRALVRFGDREFWLMQETAWELHALSIFDVGGVEKPRAVATLIVSSS